MKNWKERNMNTSMAAIDPYTWTPKGKRDNCINTYRRGQLNVLRILPAWITQINGSFS